MLRIKVCGITRLSDGMAAACLGVDAIGFVFAKNSPRYVLPDVAASMRALLPPFVSTVGVFVDESLETVRQVALKCKLDWIQLHGNESPEYCEAFEFKTLKAVRVKDHSSIDAMAAYAGCVDGFVLDAYVPGCEGGTGRCFDWRLAVEAKAHGPIILSGGLTVDNVKDAIAKVRPIGVDVSTGVETRPGIKDLEKIRRFVEEVRLNTLQEI